MAQSVDMQQANDTVNGVQGSLPEPPVQSVDLPFQPPKDTPTPPPPPELPSVPGDPVPVYPEPEPPYVPPPSEGAGRHEDQVSDDYSFSGALAGPGAFYPFLDQMHSLIEPQRREAFVAWLQQQLQTQMSALDKSDVLRVAPADGSGFDSIPPKLKDAASQPFAGVVFALVSIASYLGSLGKLRWPRM